MAEIKVPLNWLAELTRLAEQAEKDTDNKVNIAMLIGYAKSARGILQFNKRVEPIEFGGDIPNVGFSVSEWQKAYLKNGSYETNKP